MTEDFLHYVWQYKNYLQPIETTQGEEIIVLDAGMLNTGAGPDFSSAKVRIGDKVWVGNVELHLKSSDWLRHGHNTDPSYDSVVLHVVYEHDVDIVTAGGNTLDVLELKSRLKDSQYHKYKSLLGSHAWIPCSSQLTEIQDITIYAWLDRLLIERLEQKVAHIEELLQATKTNWEEAFYWSLARNFGFNTNADAFEQLAQSTPIEVLARYKDNLFQLEALLFGQANLLNGRLKDEYVNDLIMEYEFLKQKHKLTPISGHLWKFLRMRPVNFPTVRLAQFAQLVYQSSHLFSVIIQTERLVDLRKFFDLNPSAYWEEHFVFGKKTKKRTKALGQSSFDLILINTIVPYLFVYGHHQQKEHLKDRALMFLQHTKAENNSIVQRFAQEGIHAHNAGHSQALLQLKKSYCSQQKCLQCAIGLQVIKQ
jgi:hypothetical protein